MTARLRRSHSAQARGPKRWVCYPEGNHVCNNIIYKYRPLVADFMAEHLG